PPLAQTQSLSLAQTLTSPLAQTLTSPLAQTLTSPLAQTLASPLAQTQSFSLALAWPGGLSTISPTSTSSNSSSPTATSASVAPGVTFSIVSASPPADTGNNRVWTISEAVKVRPLIFSTDNKLKIIQSEAETPSSSQDSPGGPQGADSPSQDDPSVTSTTNPSSSPSSTPAKKKQKDEDPEKMSFMVALGLVTTETLEEIQIKRQERKRRSTANPAYSGLVQPERKRLASNYLDNPLFLSVRATGDYRWKEELEHDDHCSVCKEEGELQLCHNCPRAYHPDCLHPPLRTPPRGVWVCTKCQKKVLNKENMSWPQNFVQSYVTHKTGENGLLYLAGMWQMGLQCVCYAVLMLEVLCVCVCV
uniref:PHD finger protein 21B-like n=1 Tax=Salmo trutta TaxID=8032 RepID=A0A673ZGU0_SALTR